MADPQGFMKYDRQEPGYRPLDERIQDYKEVEKWLSDEESADSGCTLYGLRYSFLSRNRLSADKPDS